LQNALQDAEWSIRSQAAMALAMMDHPEMAKVFDAGAVGGAKFEISNFKFQVPQGRLTEQIQRFGKAGVAVSR